MERSEGGPFEVLVSTWSRLVFSTAVRQVVDEEAAKEVTQNVFLIAFKKIDALQQMKHTAAWFHRTAMLESSNYRRAERRRRMHLETFAATQTETEPEAPVPLSDELRARLDEALNVLRAGERALVTGRFYEGCSFQQLAERGSSTPDAVRVKLARILEKLSAVMRGRGTALTVAALASALGSQWTHAAPASLAASISTAAGFSAAGISVPAVLAIMTSGKSITLTVLALMLAAVSLHSQSRRIDDLSGKLRKREAAASTASRFTTGRPAAPDTARSPAVPGQAEGSWNDDTGPVTGKSLLRQMRGYPGTFGHHDTRFHPIDARLKKMSVEELQRLITELDAAEGGASLKHWVRCSLIGRSLAQKDPQAAVQLAVRLRLDDRAFQNIAENWITKDKEGGVPALLRLLENPDNFPVAKFGADPARALREGLAESLAEKDLPVVLTLCRNAAGTAAAGDFLGGLGEALGRSGRVDTMFELLAGVPAGQQQVRALEKLAAGLKSYQADDGIVRSFFEHPAFPQNARTGVILKVALDANAQGIDENNPAVLNFIENSSREGEAPATIVEWMRKATPPKLADRVDPDEEPMIDQMLESSVRLAASKDPALAQKWLPGIHDPDRRAKLAAELNLTPP